MPRYHEDRTRQPLSHNIVSKLPFLTVNHLQPACPCLSRPGLFAEIWEYIIWQRITATGVCAGLEVKQNITSPTFTLINEYRGRLPVYHFDFYRISSLEEAIALGIEEYFYGDGVCLIEWAERIAKVLPPDRFEVYLKHLYEPGGENKRWIQVRRVNNG